MVKQGKLGSGHKNFRNDIQDPINNFDYDKSGYILDTTQGRVFYFYHDFGRFWRYVRLAKKLYNEEYSETRISSVLELEKISER